MVSAVARQHQFFKDLVITKTTVWPRASYRYRESKFLTVFLSRCFQCFVPFCLVWWHWHETFSKYFFSLKKTH